MQEYMYGQGKIEFAEVINGVVSGEWFWIGDCSEMNGSFSEESFSHKENYTGKKGSVRKIYTGTTIEFNINMNRLDTGNVARFTQGKATSVAAGTVTNEALGTVTVGSVSTLAHLLPSNLVITDSAVTPATISPTHYEVNKFGEIEWLTLPTSPAPTMPLKAAYSYAAHTQAAFLNDTRKTYAVRYDGVNLAEDEKPVLLELYKCSAGMLQTLSMITNGNQLAAAPVVLEALLDTTKPATGNLGQYGRLIQAA